MMKNNRMKIKVFIVKMIMILDKNNRKEINNNKIVRNMI